MTLFSLLQQYTSLDDLLSLARRQGIGALLCEEITTSGTNPFDIYGFLRLEGFAQKQEKEWSKHKDDITLLSNICQEQHTNILIFKGYAMSLLYDIPQRRKSGDLDAFFFPHTPDLTILQESGNSIIQSSEPQNIIPPSKHSSLYLPHTLLESHHHFLDSDEHSRLLHAEDYLLNEVSHHKLIQSTEWPNVYYPSSNFNAVFLPLHFGQHFVYEGATLHQLIDWVVFLQKCGNQVNWQEVFTLADQCGYRKWLDLINAIADHYFNVTGEWRNINTDNKQLEAKVINDLMASQPFDRENRKHNIIKYIHGRTMKAIQDSWKLKMIYDESTIRWYLRHAYNYIKTNYKN